LEESADWGRGAPDARASLYFERSTCRRRISRNRRSGVRPGDASGFERMVREGLPGRDLKNVQDALGMLARMGKPRDASSRCASG
jgi:hypothetical protein